MDIRVRQAFIMSVDRKAIANSLFFGIVNPASGPITPSTRDYWSGVEKINQFDRAAAGKLLDDARLEDGLQRHPPERRPAARDLPADAAGTGYRRRRPGRRQEEQVRRYGRECAQGQAGRADLLQHLRYAVASLQRQRCQRAGGALHHQEHSGPRQVQLQLGTLFQPRARHAAAAGGGEGDPAKRAQDYADAQKIIANAAIFLPIHDPIEIIVYTAKATGLVFARGNSGSACWASASRPDRLADAGSLPESAPSPSVLRQWHPISYRAPPRRSP